MAGVGSQIADGRHTVLASSADERDRPRYDIETIRDLPGEWDRLAAEFSDACLEQSVAYLAPRYGAGRLHGVVFKDRANGRMVACALLVVVTLPLLGAGLAYLKFGPLWRRISGERCDLAEVLRALRAEFAGRRGLELRIVPPADPGFEAEWSAALAEAGLPLREPTPNPARYFVDISLPPDEQLASLSAKWRANLKKSAASPLDMREADIREDLPQFLELYRRMVERKGFEDTHRIETVPEVLTALPAAFRPRLFIASADGAPVAASILVGGGERILVPYSATDDRAGPLRAGFALRWYIMDALRDSGSHWLDLGGTEGNTDLEHFKAGNVGKRGRILDMPGEFACSGNMLSTAAAKGIGLARDLVRSPTVQKLKDQVRRIV
jgi:hypothetical protein